MSVVSGSGYIWMHDSGWVSVFLHIGLLFFLGCVMCVCKRVTMQNTLWPSTAKQNSEKHWDRKPLGTVRLNKGWLIDLLQTCFFRLGVSAADEDADRVKSTFLLFALKVWESFRFLCLSFNYEWMIPRVGNCDDSSLSFGSSSGRENVCLTRKKYYS